MAQKEYKFVVYKERSRTHFFIKENGIKINVAAKGGSGTVNCSHEEKIRRIAKEASARDIWGIRMAGFVDIATEARRLQNTWIWNKNRK